jgi:hypothetical protein
MKTGVRFLADETIFYFANEGISDEYLQMFVTIERIPAKRSSKTVSYVNVRGVPEHQYACRRHFHTSVSIQLMNSLNY